MRNVLSVFAIERAIEGESTLAGSPCTRVRLAGCDLDCRWCDSRQVNIKPGRLMTIEAVQDEVRNLGSELVVITGGEPLLQQDAPILARRLAEKGYAVIVDTSGACDISELPPPIIRLMDIKCPSSGMAHRMNWYNLAHLRPEDEVKFVLADRRDYEYAREILEKHGLCRRCKILFSVVWNKLSAAELAEWLLWDNLRVRIHIQLHKALELTGSR